MSAPWRRTRPRTGDPPAGERQHGGDRQDCNPLRPDACDLAEAEHVGTGGTRQRDRRDKPARPAFAARKEFLKRRIATAIAALHGHHGVEGEERGREIAVGRRREQVATDGRRIDRMAGPPTARAAG